MAFVKKSAWQWWVVGECGIEYRPKADAGSEYKTWSPRRGAAFFADYADAMEWCLKEPA